MTIEDGLEELEEKKKKESEQENKSADRAPNDLFIKCQKVVGEYLQTHFFSSGTAEKYKGFLTTLAPFVLLVEPATMSGDARQKVSLVKRIDRLAWLRCMGTIDEYLADTDLADAEDTIDIEEQGELYIPEYSSVKSGGLEHFIRDIRTSPYVPVLGMKPKNRPLIAVAASKSIEQGILGNKTHNGGNRLDKDDLKRDLFSCVPSIKSIAEVAKEYQVKEIKNAIQDLNRVIELYESRWGLK